MEIKYIHKQIYPLSVATDGSGAWDLRSAETTFEIDAFGEVTIKTGIAIWLIDKSKLGIITIRSGLSEKLTLKNAPGFLDSDYQGEILLKIINRHHDPLKIEFNDRIAQIAIVTITPPEQWNMERVTQFSQTTDRGESGWGSSGKK